MRFQLVSCSIVVAQLLAGCGSDVPIGSGKHNANGVGGTGATAGSAGASGAAGAGARPGVGGAAGSGGTAATGGAAGASGAPSGGSGGVGATGGGGSTATCPSNTAAVQRVIPGNNPRDTLQVKGSLYYSETDLADSKISIVQLPSGAPQVIGSKALYPAQAKAFKNADALVSDGTSIYWRAEEGARIWKMPLAGGTPVEIASIPGVLSFGSTAGLPDSLTLNATHLFWAQGSNPVGNSEVEYVLYQVPLSGGVPKKLGSYQSDTNDIMKTFQPLSLRADATHLYFTRVSGGASGLHRIPLAGGPDEDVFGSGYYIDLNQTDVYGSAGGVLWRHPKTGGATSVVSTGLDPNKYSLVAHGVSLSATHVYSGYLSFVFQGSELATCGVVLKSPLAGPSGTPTVLWEGDGNPLALSQSASVVAMVDVENESVVLLNP